MAEKIFRIECFDCSHSPSRSLMEKKLDLGETMSIVLDSDKVYPEGHSPQLVFFELFTSKERKRVLNFTEVMEVSLRNGDEVLCFHFKNGVIDGGDEEFTKKSYLQKKDGWQIILDDVLADPKLGGKLQGEISLGTFKVNFSYT